MIDKIKIKAKLEKERDLLLPQLLDIGRLNTETGEWEAVPEENPEREADQNNMADRFEDFESRSSMIKVLEERMKNIQNALKAINKSTFGTCKICKKEIEKARLEANPAARTCKKHLEDN